MQINATLLGQMITFLVFVWFTMKFVWPQLQEKILIREKNISEGLAAADKYQIELASIKKEKKIVLQDAQVQAQEIIAKAEKQAKQYIDDAIVKAKEEVAKIKQQMELELEQNISASKKTLMNDVISLIIDGTNKVIKREVKATDHAAMLQELLARQDA